MFKVLNPLHLLKLLYFIFTELLGYFIDYLPKIKYLENNGELERIKIRTDLIKQLCFVVNIPTDILFMNSSNQEIIEFEKNIVTQTMEKRGYSAYFSRENLLDIIRIRKMNRIKDNYYYAYLVKMWYKFEYTSFTSLFKLALGLTFYYFLIKYILSHEYTYFIINEISKFIG